MSTSPQAENHSPTRPLPVVRAMIDAVDRDVLQLLARRNALVAEIAQYKREHALPIRDLVRDAEIIADRCARAQRLGLSPELIESLFRLVLWGSRDRQAALKAEVPPDVESRTIAIIGGNGAMGRRMAELFGDLGHAVMIADVDTALKPVDAAALADVVLISVPIDVTEAVIAEVGPQVRPEALLLDVTSVKTGPVTAMLAASPASVVGMHPLFGPSVHSLQGQRIVLTPGRAGAWLDWLRAMLRARGLLIVESTPQDHDRAMAIVQVLTHFSTEVLGLTLARLGVPIDATLAFTSPIYLIELLLVGRHFAQSADLYAAIQRGNPQTAQIMAAFASAVEELRGIAASSEAEEFRAMFSEVGAFFATFRQRALQQSDFLIDRIVERA